MHQKWGVRRTLAVLAAFAIALLPACGGGNGDDEDPFGNSGRSVGGGYSRVGNAGGAGGGTGNAGAGLSSGQENAVGSAKAYISTSGFSRSGLIEQLEFEGYSTKNAAFAVDHLNVDWNEQAARSAENYLSMSGFSRSGLVEQLMFEGYTRPQAEYGAGKALGGGNGGANSGGAGARAGSGPTSGQENALRTAENYISMSGFSRSGLIEQLEFEGHSTSDATFAVDHLNVDWNEQAARSAESYLSMSGFSRTGLVEQLMFEGYTRQQAEYGADKAL
jgi:uncharacterized protein YodC (DUF2158 family)